MKRLQMRPIPPDGRPVCSVEPEDGGYAVALVHYALNTDGTINPGAAQVSACRIAASWNALADADLDTLERDGLLAEPKVAALVEAVKGILELHELGLGYIVDDGGMTESEQDEALKQNEKVKDALRALERKNE